MNNTQKTQFIGHEVQNESVLTKVYTSLECEDPMEATVGDLFGRCKIERFIGVGGAGAVYLATHVDLGVKRAIKVLRRDVLMDPRMKNRFLKEAKLSASFNHQNIVQVHHAGEDNGRFFIEMEFVDGISLRKLMKERGRIPFPIALVIAEQVAHALHHIHVNGGAVHRDVKPENILVRNDGVVKLADFGIARVDGSTGETATGTIVGTCGYMSLEQIDGKPLDGRTDIYALTVVIYEMIAGAAPYNGDTLTAVIRSIIAANHLPLNKLVAALPSELLALVSAGLKPKAESRPQSAKKYIKNINRIMDSTGYDNADFEELLSTWLNKTIEITVKTKKKRWIFKIILAIFPAALLCGLYYYINIKSFDTIKEIAVIPPIVVDTVTSVAPPTVEMMPDTVVNKTISEVVRDSIPKSKVSKPVTVREKDIVMELVAQEPPSVIIPHIDEFDRIVKLEEIGSASHDLANEWKGYIKTFSKDTAAAEIVKMAKTKLLACLKKQ